MNASSLPPPHRYFPIVNGRYEVKPGLRRLSGNVFQIDRQFDSFMRCKRAARAERLSKYFSTANLDSKVEHAVNHFILRRSIAEQPGVFSFDGQRFQSHLTGDVLRFSPQGEYLRSDSSASPEYAGGLDALASQVQEDLAVMSTDGDRHWLSAVHLCSPNHWSAEEKIGKSFAGIHEPVAGIDAINRQAELWVRTMVNAVDGLERLAWGVATDDRLNHHPDGLLDRCFDPRNPSAFLRVERQTMWGFPDVGATLFTIRTSFIDCAEIRSIARERDALTSAIRSMTMDSLRYKGIEPFRDNLLSWLDAGV